LKGTESEEKMITVNKEKQKYFDGQGFICYTLMSFALSDEPNPKPFKETLHDDSPYEGDWNVDPGYFLPAGGKRRKGEKHEF
jgi:hypothetical protein